MEECIFLNFSILTYKLWWFLVNGGISSQYILCHLSWLCLRVPKIKMLLSDRGAATLLHCRCFNLLFVHQHVCQSFIWCCHLLVWEMLVSDRGTATCIHSRCFNLLFVPPHVFWSFTLGCHLCVWEMLLSGGEEQQPFKY